MHRKKKLKDRDGDELPHYVDGEGSGAGKVAHNYWRLFLTCADGEIVLGTGSTPEKAKQHARHRREKYEDMLKGLPLIQLQRIAAKPELYDGDYKKAIKLISAILSEKP